MGAIVADADNNAFVQNLRRVWALPVAGVRLLLFAILALIHAAASVIHGGSCTGSSRSFHAGGSTLISESE